MRRIYIAGPDVFFADAAARAAAKKALCAVHGFQGLHPLDQPAEGARAIYAHNRAMMDAADAIVANLTPFRGPSADPGTVFELGAMVGSGRAAFGYSASAGAYRLRVPGARHDGAAWHDADGALVEDFDLADNLMIACAVPLVRPDRARADADLWCFERCLEAAAAHFRDRS